MGLILGQELNKTMQEIQESNGMRKTRELFKKTGDIKEHLMQGWAR